MVAGVETHVDGGATGAAGQAAGGWTEARIAELHCANQRRETVPRGVLAVLFVNGSLKHLEQRICQDDELRRRFEGLG